MSDVTITAPRRFRPAATRRVQVLVALAALVSALMLLTLSCGRGCLPPGDVWAALRGRRGPMLHSW